MRAIAILSLALCSAPAAAWAADAVAPHDTVHAAPVSRDTLAGTWHADDGDPAPIRIRRSGDGYALDRASHWSGFGRLEGVRFEGRFESQRSLGDTLRVAGLLNGHLAGHDRLEVTLLYTRGRRGALHQLWRRADGAPTPYAPLVTREGGRRLPVDDTMEHPIWPPPRDPTPRHRR